ncbi:hypothetical protein RUM43_008884 [Polyplax serrata]|uniref:Uncharacterized protein n=1 Tax=Polyplax serrata TaxID=468196 RepID=A0AAN8PB24_POLSC
MWSAFSMLRSDHCCGPESSFSFLRTRGTMSRSMTRRIGAAGKGGSTPTPKDCLQRKWPSAGEAGKKVSQWKSAEKLQTPPGGVTQIFRYDRGEESLKTDLHHHHISLVGEEEFREGDNRHVSASGESERSVKMHKMILSSIGYPLAALDSRGPAAERGHEVKTTVPMVFVRVFRDEKVNENQHGDGREDADERS